MEVKIILKEEPGSTLYKKEEEEDVKCARRCRGRKSEGAGGGKTVVQLEAGIRHDARPTIFTLRLNDISATAIMEQCHITIPCASLKPKVPLLCSG